MVFRHLSLVFTLTVTLAFSGSSIWAGEELALNSTPKKVVKKGAKTTGTKRSPAATKKTTPPPKSKKNLKKGKNVDTSKTKKKPVVKAKLRPELPSQTRAEMLSAAEKEREAQELVAKEAADKELAAKAGAGAVMASTGSEEPSLDQPIDDGEISAEQPIEDEIANGSEEVALDLGSGETAWSPYTFGRSSLWILLPFLTLAFLGLHLLPVPKRRYPKRLSAVPDFLKLKDKPATNTGHVKSRGDTNG